MMDAIYKFKSNKLVTTEGVFAEEMEKSVIKKKLLKAIKLGKLTGTLIDEDGDVDETESTIDISNSTAVIFCVGEEYFKVLGHSEQLSDDESEDQTIHLVDVVEEGDWILGKSYKRLNTAKVNSDEYVALRKDKVEALPITTDNYIDAHMSWVFDQLITDFEDRYGSADTVEEDEIDDGD
jgi:hypothetical protein